MVTIVNDTKYIVEVHVPSDSSKFLYIDIDESVSEFNGIYSLFPEKVVYIHTGYVEKDDISHVLFADTIECLNLCIKIDDIMYDIEYRFQDDCRVNVRDDEIIYRDMMDYIYFKTNNNIITIKEMRVSIV